MGHVCATFEGVFAPAPGHVVSNLGVDGFHAVGLASDSRPGRILISELPSS